MTVTRRRVAQCLAVFAVFNVGLAAVLLAAQFPARDPDATMPDFLAFWAAGRLAVEGTPWLAYDPEAHRAVQRQAVGLPFTQWLVFYYPPPFQALLAPFGALPFAAGMAAWVAATLGLFAWVCRRILPGWPTLLAVLAAPPTLLNMVTGQTGFLIAGLAGLVLLWQRERPAAAGGALALMALKPHVATAIPLALLAAGRWRVLGWGTAGGVLLLLGSVLLLGTAAWGAFLAFSEVLAGVLTDFARRWELNPTVYALARLGGLDAGAALAVHAVPALGALGLTLRAWRRPGTAPDIRAALACYAALIVTPRLLNYDLTLMLVGALFQARHALAAGAFRGEAVLMGAVLVALELSVLVPPGVAPLAAPVLFAACWLGHGRQP